MRRVIFCGLLLMLQTSGFTNNYTDAEGRAAWAVLSRQPINENTFRATCDLMQDIGRNDLKLSYEILASYVPVVKATGNKAWWHILMMGWAKAKESTGYFEEAQKLYFEVCRDNPDTSRYFREALVTMALMYGEWGRIDSLDRCVQVGEPLCKTARDDESLSFLYCFKAMTRNDDTGSMRQYFDKAIALASRLPDKNALFTARYNYAYMYLQNNLQKQVAEFDALYELSKDATLNHYPRKLYERTAFTFRNAGPSVYYNLMQVNLLLADYEGAWKFAKLFYDATVKPNPNGVNAPYFNADMAIVKAYQKDYAAARQFLNRSYAQFQMAEDSIPYASYFIAAGMLAEQSERIDTAIHYYEIALKKGNTQSQHMIPPEIYYVHALIRKKRFDDAEKVLSKFNLSRETRKYSVVGLNYYRYQAELLRAREDYSGYASALETYYGVRDSLTNLARYRAIEQMQTKMLLQSSEEENNRLSAEYAARVKAERTERMFYLMLIGFSACIIALLALYLRNRQVRAQQQEALHQGRLEQLERQRSIELMEKVLEAQERERKSVASQLHDEVGSMLALASLNTSSVIEKRIADEPAQRKLERTQDILTSIASTVRDLSHQLTPLMIEKFGFSKAIEDLATSINSSGKLQVSVTIIGFDGAVQHAGTFLNELYRIVQELLHNVLAHAEASRVALELVEHHDCITLMVEDNGKGFNTSAGQDGMGLQNIRSRIGYLKGRMEIDSRENKGTRVTIEMPV